MLTNIYKTETREIWERKICATKPTRQKWNTLVDLDEKWPKKKMK